MADFLTPSQRSAHMARIRRADTAPELAVRKLLHHHGYRFRVQQKGVPGRPDIALPGRQKAIFVHGCFWHAHEGCEDCRVPKTRSDFWLSKFENNRSRDRRLLAAAEALGWKCLVVWECETRDCRILLQRLRSFLGPSRQPGRDYPKAGIRRRKANDPKRIP